MDFFRHAGAFAAQQQYVIGPESELQIASFGFRGQQDQAAGLVPKGVPVRLPRDVIGKVHPVQVVHAGAAQFPVGDREPRRPDDIDADAQARRRPHHRAGVAGDVRLVEGYSHRDIQVRGVRKRFASGVFFIIPFALDVSTPAGREALIPTGFFPLSSLPGNGTFRRVGG